VYVPAAREVVVEIVRTEDTVPPGGGVTEAGLKITVIFVGTPAALKSTGELKVPIDVIPIATVPLFPRITDFAVGDDR